MATFDYEGLKTQTAEPLLERFGKSATLIKPGTPSGPPYNPVPGVPTEHPVTVVQTEYKLRDIDGTLIQQGDKKLLVSTKNAPVPAMNDTIRSGSVVYQIINILPLDPGPVVMLWRLQVRK
jgi:hypothetical protein